MSQIISDQRPPAGWSERPDDKIVFTMHDASFLASPPEREGFAPYFIARHGVGPGSWTSWTYKRLPREAAG